MRHEPVTSELTRNLIPEARKSEIIAYALANGKTATCTDFKISHKTLTKLLEDENISMPYTRQMKPTDRDGQLKNRISELLNKMMGKWYQYMACDRLLKGYHFTEKYLLIDSQVEAESGAYPRQIRLSLENLKEVKKELEKEFRLQRRF